MTDVVFDHEKLDVYRVACDFAGWAGELLDGPLAGCRLNALNQLDRASTSIPLNIAEGNGKRSGKDRARFLDVARGSAFECAAALDVLVVRKKLRADQIAPGKALLRRAIGMLSKLTAKLLGQDELRESPR